MSANTWRETGATVKKVMREKDEEKLRVASEK